MLMIEEGQRLLSEDGIFCLYTEQDTINVIEFGIHMQTKVSGLWLTFY